MIPTHKSANVPSTARADHRSERICRHVNHPTAVATKIEDTITAVLTVPARSSSKLFISLLSVVSLTVCGVNRLGGFRGSPVLCVRTDFNAGWCWPLAPQPR